MVLPVIDERYMNFEQWTAQMTPTLARYSYIPKGREDAWQEWARFVISIPVITAINPPRPEVHKDWRNWVREFNDNLMLLRS